MDANTLKLHLSKLDQLVLDEAKIVSYKCVSRNLGVHVNTAKQLLHTYLEEQGRLSSCSLSATYLVAGRVKDGSYIVSLIADSDWDVARSKFMEITSEHIYSIQKSPATSLVKNYEALYVADSNLMQTQGCLIKCKRAVQRVDRETQKESLDEVKSEKATNNGGVKECGGDKSPPLKAAKTSNRNHIGNFFNNQAQRQAQRKAKLDEANEEKMNNHGNKSQSTVLEPSIEKARLEELSIVDEEITEENHNGSKKARKRLKKTVSDRKSAKKKRKRILSDSEDSDIVTDEEMEDAMLSMQPEEATANGGRLNVEEEPENTGDLFQSKRKRKKIVDETFENEDGYIETKKVVVYETDSEEEPSSERKERIETGTSGRLPPSAASEDKPLEGKKNNARDANKNNVKKQSSLLSFFKKK